jgi:hypothetical protein
MTDAICSDNVAVLAEDLLKDHRGGHDHIQVANFILGNGNHTPFARYRQALRELDGRHRAMKQLTLQRRRLELDIRSAELRSILLWHRARRAIDLEEKRMSLQELDKAIADTRREYESFTQHAYDLRQLLGQMDEERRAELTHDMWMTSIAVRLQLEVRATGTVSQRTLETLLALAREDRTAIIATVPKLSESLPPMLTAPPEEAAESTA